jgi:hypothetical protein
MLQKHFITCIIHLILIKGDKEGIPPK